VIDFEELDPRKFVRVSEKIYFLSLGRRFEGINNTESVDCFVARSAWRDEGMANPSVLLTSYLTVFQGLPAKPVEAVPSIVRLSQLDRTEAPFKTTTGETITGGGSSVVDEVDVVTLLFVQTFGEQSAVTTRARRVTWSPGTIVACLFKVTWTEALVSQVHFA